MDDDQQFCLRWNNHQSTLVAVFDTLLEKGIHVDCTLAAEGQTLKAHKVVLSACSPYFESVLSQQYDKHPIIILKDVKYAELRAMMDYMYRGEVNISQDQLAALLKAAESLQIKGLSDNKPSRPPSRPPPPAAAHPPRAPSPPPQVRDGSIDSREGSVSPTRRRKKARRLSTEGVPAAAPALPLPLPLPLPPANDNAQHGAADEQLCKEETHRDGVEDLTIDEEADEPPAVTHNDVVRNFQWHMERSQDEMLNSSDGVRDSQETPIEMLNIQNFIKSPFPLTRGYLKAICGIVDEKKEPKGHRGRKSLNNIMKKKVPVKKPYKKNGLIDRENLKIFKKAKKAIYTELNNEDSPTVKSKNKKKSIAYLHISDINPVQPKNKHKKSVYSEVDVDDDNSQSKEKEKKSLSSERDTVNSVLIKKKNKKFVCSGIGKKSVQSKNKTKKSVYSDKLNGSSMQSKKKEKKSKKTEKISGTGDENSNLSSKNDKKYVCTICHKKAYKYRRNKLRHEKYECVTGPQFACNICYRKYSQKKTLVAHVNKKHTPEKTEPVNNEALL